MEAKKPIEVVADAFKELAAAVNSRKPAVPLKEFADACSLISSFFGILVRSSGGASPLVTSFKFFKFVQQEYGAKSKDMAAASRSISTLEAMVDKDIEADCAKKVGSNTRNLLALKRGIELIKVLCEEFLATEGENCFKDAALKAYHQVLFRHHGYNVQKACATGLYLLPPKSLFLHVIDETEETVKINMQSYVTATTPVVAYIDKLFLSKNLGIDW